MKPVDKKNKVPKKAVRVQSKNAVIKEEFITFGIDCPEVGSVSAIRSNISDVDVDAYYIKKVDDGKEKCVYFRKIGNQARVLFAEEKTQGHIPFTPYALSEFSLNKILHGTDRRVSDDSLVIADRVIGENEIDYISMFMPADHQLKRKKGISVALTNDEKYEYTAFYWKKGKSVACANSTYIPVLFDALETVTFNNAVLASPEQAAQEIVLESEENGSEESETEAEIKEIVEVSELEEMPQEEELNHAKITTEETETQENIEENQAKSPEEVEAEPADDNELVSSKKEKKPKKESFFARRRAKKQLKKQKAVQKEQSEQIVPEPEQVQESKEEPAEDEISAEEAEVLAQALSVDLFSEEEFEDIFENPFEDEPEQPKVVVEEQEEGTEAVAEEISEEAQEPEAEPSEVSEEVEEISEEAEEVAEEAEIIADEEEVIAEETAILEEAKEEIAETKLEIIEEEKHTKKEKAKKNLFAKKAKKKKVSEPEASEKKAKKKKEKKKKNIALSDEKTEDIEEELSIEEVQVLPEEPAKSEEKLSVEDFFENEKPLTLLQILEAADISNDNKKTFLQYMKPAILNTVYVVPITDSGENVDAVYVSKKAANLLEGKDYPIGENKELIFPDDEREELRKHIKLKTIMSSGEAFIPAFTSTEMFEQIFGKAERCGLFAFPNLCSQTEKNEQIKGVIINPDITDLKFLQEELREY